MSRILRTRARLLAHIAAPVVLASALGACSSIPDWVDPTGWFGSDSQVSSDQSGDATTDAAQTPDLASIPPKPAPPSTPDEQQQVANSLTADRSQAQYSAEALQGGTEPVAPPPPPASADTTATPAPAATTDNTPASETPPSTADSSAPSAATPESAAQPLAAPDSSGTQLASTESPATTAPAAASMATATARNAQPGFAPSHAPPLDPSVAQYVPQRILSRYQQTAAAAAVPGVEGMSTGNAAKSAHRRKAKAAQTAPATDTTAPAQ